MWNTDGPAEFFVIVGISHYLTQILLHYREYYAFVPGSKNLLTNLTH